jgi:TPR repeat protein
MSQDSIVCFVLSSLFVVGVLCLVKLAADANQETARKKDELLDLAKRDPQPKVFMQLAELAFADGQSSVAMDFLKKAAALGSAKAAQQVAENYLNLDGGVDSHFEYMLKSAELGGEVAMCKVAAAYKDGRGTLKNIGKSTHWLLRSAEAGNAESMTQVALAYIEGFGLAENPMEGLAWLYVAEFKQNDTAAGLIKNAEAK